MFSEVLYYLSIREAIVEVNRYAKYLSPDGLFFISMKDDPKAYATFRGVCRRFKHIRSIVFQVNSAHNGLKFHIKVNKAFHVYTIGAFAPKRTGNRRAADTNFFPRLNKRMT